MSVDLLIMLIVTFGTHSDFCQQCQKIENKKLPNFVFSMNLLVLKRLKTVYRTNLWKDNS